jgi:murein DD-endopeptidase MepM/ murein hydrolase activator NlpD
MIKPTNNPITLRFGATTYPYTPQSPHIGVDFAPTPDNTIYAPEDGRITLVLGDPQMGDSIHLWVDNRHHAFCHTSQRSVGTGQQVKQGDKLGVMGYTGYVVPSGPAGTHLHWALAVNNVLIDPLSQVTEQNNESEGPMVYPNRGDIINMWQAFGRPSPNDNDFAYWTSGTGNPNWPKGADEVWKALCYELSGLVPQPSADTTKLEQIKKIIGS